MIKFVTDVMAGESPFESAIFAMDLRIFTLDGEPIKILLPPSSGWCHQSLMALAESRELMEHMVDGADAFLGETWVGSTEI